jgi:hypothetical protein
MGLLRPSRPKLSEPPRIAGAGRLPRRGPSVPLQPRRSGGVSMAPVARRKTLTAQEISAILGNTPRGLFR